MTNFSPATQRGDERPWTNRGQLRCSVIICAHTEDRWADTLRAVASARRQLPEPFEVIVIVDSNPQLLARLSSRLRGVLVAPNAQQRGLSGAKNTGVMLATGDVVAFLDDDAIAQSGWLAALMRRYSDPDVIGVGGRTEPGWSTRRPRWFPDEFDWVIGCTYTGREPGVVRNLLGGNASFRRDLFALGGFASHIGRSTLHRRPLGCEETEFCIRVNKAWPGCVFVYDEDAVIVHRVPPAREGFAYFRSRCFAEGMSKALVTQSVGFADSLSTEFLYTATTLTAGLRLSVWRALQGSWSELLCGGAIAIGLLYTVCGYLHSVVDSYARSVIKKSSARGAATRRGLVKI